MKAKRFKFDIPTLIVDKSIDDARKICLAEGYVLSLGDKVNLNDTYLVSVTDLGPDGKILNAKYGK